MPQEFKPLSVGNNVTVIPCVEPVKKIVWIFVMIFSKCLLNRYFIFSLNPPPFFCLFAERMPRSAFLFSCCKIRVQPAHEKRSFITKAALFLSILLAYSDFYLFDISQYNLPFFTREISVN